MISTRKFKYSILATIILLISVSIFIDYSSDISYNMEESLKSSEISGEIQIFGNSEWENVKTAGLCTGSGTSSDPYVIKNLEINAGGSGNCIRIQDTDVYFKIQNCTLSYASGEFDAAIHFQCVQNGIILNNEIFNNKVGIFLDPSSIQNRIQGNVLHDNTAWAIDLFQTSQVVISANEIYNNVNGILLDDKSSQNVIESNNIYENNIGIHLWGSDHNIIRNNTVNSYITVMEIDYSDSNKIYDNTLSSSESGIRLDHSDDNQISNNILSHFNYAISISVNSRNQITQNTITYSEIGIYIGEKSTCNTISNNIFSNNGMDIYGSQEICLELLLPILIGIVLLVSISAVIMILIRRRAHHKKVLKDQNGLSVQKTYAEEKPISKKEKLLKKPTSTYEEIEENELLPIPTKGLIEMQKSEDLQESNDVVDDEQPILETTALKEFQTQKQDIEEETVVENLEHDKKEAFKKILDSEEQLKSDLLHMQEPYTRQDLDIKKNKLQEVERVKKEEKSTGERIEVATSTSLNMGAKVAEPDKKVEAEEREQLHEIQIEEKEKEETKIVKEKESREEKVTKKLVILPTGNLNCPYCGFNNPDDASYCLQCGQTIKKQK